jgi:hypothetical protein
MSTEDLLQVLTNLKSTSSGRGNSYYSQRCARKARLDEEFGSGDSSYDAQVGVVFHKLDELYATGALKNYVLPVFDTYNEDDPVQEALRVFAVYCQRFPADEFETVCAERFMPVDSAQAKIICETMGVDPYTLRIDRVIKVSQEQADAAFMRRKVGLFPGYYILDTKTASKKDANAALLYELSTQFPSYVMAWNAAYPEMTVNGVLVNRVIRHKKLTEESFQTFLVESPSEMTRTAVKNHLRRKAAYLKTDEPNLDACADWRGCNHYKNGNCNRI